MESFGDTVTVLRSLAEPKKVDIYGSDGNSYTFLCKPKDDLRKDTRMMEFDSILNKLLKKHPESRERQLYIRTYSVIPLNEECGIIEWVPNTKHMRGLMTHLYLKDGINMKAKIEEAKKRSAQLSDKLSVADWKKIGKKFPPILYKFFTTHFPEPATWWRARLSYVRTIAVMSIVGYIVGLGDRHCENILFDCNNGDLIHVDFNCLFFKGQTFLVPEKVPFRLTPQLQDALGLTGYDGTYRKVCEITLNLLRANKATLRSVLETFIHDPLVEWAKSGASTKRNKTANTNWKNEIERKGQSSIKGIVDRLEGKFRSFYNATGVLQPLSVEGHVNALILEATNEQNLAEMYKGWLSYL